MINSDLSGENENHRVPLKSTLLIAFHLLSRNSDAQLQEHPILRSARLYENQLWLLSSQQRLSLICCVAGNSSRHPRHSLMLSTI